MTRALYLASVWLFALVQAVASWFPVSAPKATQTDFSFLAYPTQAVQTFEQAGLSEQAWKSRADDGEEYEAAKGWSDVNAVMVSPCYTAYAADREIPVYATIAFLGSTRRGELQSFSEIYVPAGEPFCVPLTLRSGSVRLRSAVVLPRKAGVSAACKNGTVTAAITACGIYTFLFNGAKQAYAYTLFVREETDEDAEIAAFRAQYGDGNVTVFDAGVHELDYLNVPNADGCAVYLRRGAYLIARHNYSIRSASDERLYAEDGALENSDIGLTRYPFLNFYRCKDIHIVGNGAIDLSHLDRRERRGVVFCGCENVELRGVKIFNAPEWSCITYGCRGVQIENVDIFGYRINSDAFALCNTQHARVDGCFARSGDDLFDVKALGGSMDSEDVTFTRCVAWGGKARCFGICGEVVRGIRRVTFEDCAVVWRDATWDNDRVCSLAIVVEDGGGCVEDVTFSDVEVFRDEGRAIGCLIYGEDVRDFAVRGVTFRNVAYTATLPSKIARGNERNTVEATLMHVRANGVPVHRFRRMVETDAAVVFAG